MDKEAVAVESDKGALNWQRAVIKVGSSLIAPDDNGCSTKYLLALADFIIESHHQQREIVLVSSGGVAAGASKLSQPFDRQTLSIPQKQALAAIGQSRLMQHWQRLFDFPCAQLLLTRSDIESSQRSTNAKNTLDTLLSMGALPIINENDSVAIDELVVGDNDNLAAQVACLCHADLLIICSDVDGLYDKNPQRFADAKLISRIEVIDETILSMAETTDNPIATGGMLTKLSAAIIATSQGIDTLIVNGRKASTYQQLKQANDCGTHFVAAQKV